MRNILIETDLGSDPDDFFAICYLADRFNIRAITLVPGSPDQISIARFLLDEVGLDIPVGVSKLGRDKQSSGGIHHELLKKYRRGLAGRCDMLGKDVIKEAFDTYPDASLFVIGPPTSVGNFLRENPDREIKELVMQGGFLSYASNPFSDKCTHLEKFEGKETCATFNMNGDIKGTYTILSANIRQRMFVGKHICHTFTFGKQLLEEMKKPETRAQELFMEGLGLYFAKNREKNLHDLCAALCMTHPYQIGCWIRGFPYRKDGGWGTKVTCNTSDLVLTTLDKEKATQYITEWR